MILEAPAVRRIFTEAASSSASALDERTFLVLAELDSGEATTYLAMDCKRRAVVLIAKLRGAFPSGFSTRALQVAALDGVSFVVLGRRSTGSAVALTCLDDELLDAFSALGAAVAVGLAAEGPFGKVLTGVIDHWRRLFAAPARLSTKEEVGLWGELWVIASSTEKLGLLGGWRGPEAGTVDFLVNDVALEVKSSRRPGVHVISQTQVDSGEAKGCLLSLAVESSESGRSIGDLWTTIAGDVTPPTQVMTALARRGLSRYLFQEEATKFALLAKPLLFPLSMVPRVRAFDPGVSDLRYTISIDASKAMVGSELRVPLEVFGLLDSECGN